MQKTQSDDANTKQTTKRQDIDAQKKEYGEAGGQQKLSEQEIVQMYKNQAASKRKKDKTLLTKLKEKVKELKKDDSNVYPLY